MNRLLLTLLQSDLLPGLNPAPADTTKLSKAAADIAELKQLSFEELIDRVARSAVDFATNLLLAIVVYYIGRFIIRKIYKLIQSIFISRRVDRSLSTFILSLINILLYFILIVTVIGILGIETTSFLAIFASAGVAIGMALSGTLQNFAGGVLILLLKPYKIGDYIEAQGYSGTVKEIQIFFTVITTYDNKSIMIPNGGLSTGSVNNWSRESHRRVSWDIAISYGDDVTAARKAILEMFAADERIMPAEHLSDASVAGKPVTASGDIVECSGDDENDSDDENSGDGRIKSPSIWRRIFHHARAVREMREAEAMRRKNERNALARKKDYSPNVLLNSLGDSSVNLQVRAWVKTPEYWNVFYHYNEKFYEELPDHGIHFPFPQMDVHLTHVATGE